MKSALKLLVLIDLIFILLLSLSGGVSGVVGDVLYFAAFIIPVFIALFGAGGDASQSELKEELINKLKPSKSKLLFTLPLLAPVVLVVILLSLLTSLVLGELGFESPTVEDEALIIMLLRHALVPSILEEMLFRLVPMLLLGAYSKRSCVLYSSLFFALIHCNLFQIPYALAAGALFMIADLAADSIIPSLLLHILNNTLSVISIKYLTTNEQLLIYVGAIFLVAVISLAFIIKRKREYKSALSYALSGKLELKVLSPLALIIPTVAVAVANLI